MSPVSISLPCALVKGKTTEHSESSGNCQPALETHIEREVHCLALLPHKRQDLGSGFWLPDCPAVVSGHTDTCPAQPVVALCSQPWQRAQVLILVQEGVRVGVWNLSVSLLAVPAPSWVANTCPSSSRVWKPLYLDSRNRVNGENSELGPTGRGCNW